MGVEEDIFLRAKSANMAIHQCLARPGAFSTCFLSAPFEASDTDTMDHLGVPGPFNLYQHRRPPPPLSSLAGLPGCTPGNNTPCPLQEDPAGGFQCDPATLRCRHNLLAGPAGSNYTTCVGQVPLSLLLQFHVPLTLLLFLFAVSEPRCNAYQGLLY